MVLPKTITIKSNDNDDDNVISKKKDAIMNMNVLPLEIVNTSNDAEDTLLLCCPPEISTKIQWNILQYQSKFLKSQIIPIYYHSHLTYHNNNHRNSNNSNNDENMIYISSW